MTRPKRVLFLHVDGRVRGGPMAFLRLTLERLDPQQVSAQLISLGGGHGAEDLALAGFDVQIWPDSRIRDLTWTARTALRLLRHVRQTHVDLIISNGPKEHLLGGTIAALLRLPCAWVSHLVWRDRLLFSGPARRIPVQAIVANSRTTFDALPPSLQRRARIIPFGPPPATLDRATRERAASLRQSWGNPYAVLVCLGVFAPEKGQHQLLEAVATLVRGRPNLVLVLVGDDPRATSASTNSYRDRLRGFVDREGLGRNIIFHGYTEDIYPPLLAADVVVHPSVVPETFGFALVEAMQAGSAIVASDLGAQAELIEPGVTGLLVPPGDTPALCAAITRLLDEPGLACRIGETARERVAERYTADRMAAGMQSLMLELIDRRRS